jgi:PKD repeat protein
MRRPFAILLTSIVSLFVTAGAAQAVVVDMGAAGRFGVALVPGTNRATAGIQTITSSAPCSDPWLSSDLGGPVLPSTGLCWHGGAVMHSNETFDLAWDPLRRAWATTRNYVEQFLRDVANGSGTLTSPYAVTTQYKDPTGRAGNASLYGGGCIDYGSRGGATCQFGNSNGTGVGNGYPASGCPVTGTNQFHQTMSGAFGLSAPNDICLTDAQLKGELATMVAQEGLVGHIQPGYTPLLGLMTPPGIVTCLDAAGTVCSANGTIAPPIPTLSTASSGGAIAAGAYQVAVTYVTAAGETLASASRTVTTSGSTSTLTITSPPAVNGATGWYAYVTQAGGTSYTRQQTAGSPTAIGTNLTLTAPPTGTGAAPPLVSTPSFCSYHSRVTVGGTEFAYVVQPWTALTGLRGCDEPDAPMIPQNPSAQELATAVGARLVSPLSQGQLAAIVDPGLDGWSALDGSEINDNGYPDGCVPLADGLDKVTVGGTGYLLQREFNNGGLLETDPNALTCAPSVSLSPTFVVPSAANQGDVVVFDGSKTVSSLLVPNVGYGWEFGDGKTAIGPSVVHTYANGGSFAVKLTVTDRGGNVASLSQTINVLGPTGQSVSPPSTHPNPGLHVRLLLVPQSLRTVRRIGVAVRVSSNESADGTATLSISRAAAKRAHISAGRGASVAIGRGTVSGIKDGTVTLHLRLSRAIAAKLGRLGHVTLTVRLALVAAGGDHLTIVAAGRY